MPAIDPQTIPACRDVAPSAILHAESRAKIAIELEKIQAKAGIEHAHETEIERLKTELETTKAELMVALDRSRRIAHEAHTAMKAMAPYPIKPEVLDTKPSALERANAGEIKRLTELLLDARRKIEQLGHELGKANDKLNLHEGLAEINGKGSERAIDTLKAENESLLKDNERLTCEMEELRSHVAHVGECDRAKLEGQIGAYQETIKQFIANRR